MTGTVTITVMIQRYESEIYIGLQLRYRVAVTRYGLQATGYSSARGEEPVLRCLNGQ